MPLTSPSARLHKSLEAFASAQRAVAVGEAAVFGSDPSG